MEEEYEYANELVKSRSLKIRDRYQNSLKFTSVLAMPLKKIKNIDAHANVKETRELLSARIWWKISTTVP